MKQYCFLAKKFVFLLFITLSLRASTAMAQSADSTGPFTIDRIDTWKIHSSAVGSDFTIYVLKTDDYDTGKARLPVLYMTDGDWNMTVAMNCLSMLRQDYTTHEPLVVGIGYGKNQNMRGRDLDPKGGGPKFLSFIEKEVMPFIDKTYRTSNERALYGYSLGGMLTTYVLFNRADLFQKIFIGAPGNNGRELMPSARQYFSNNKCLSSNVFIGVGSFEAEVVRNIDSFTTYLRSKKCRALTIRSDITPNAGHGAALAQVMQNAIAFGYCERHNRVKISPSVLSGYTGSYVYYKNGKALERATVFTKNNSLLIKWSSPTSLPYELVPYANDSFFIPANERHTIRFTGENGERAMVITVAGDKEYKWIKQKL